jgi:hypothetical protein
MKSAKLDDSTSIRIYIRKTRPASIVAQLEAHGQEVGLEVDQRLRVRPDACYINYGKHKATEKGKYASMKSI